MKYSKYHAAIKEEMEEFAKDPKVIFLGQQTASEDFYNTLKDVPMNKRYEMPVAEEMQMGISIGLALQGFIPISIYQRIDFLPRACDQLVNHLNLIKELSRNKFNPKVIIRTTIGSRHPLDTGLQHSKDLTRGFIELLDMPVLKVTNTDQVKDAYKIARESKNSILIIEQQDLYKEKE